MAAMKYGYSIIACTKRAAFIHSLFSNYARQKWARKEMIVVINNDAINVKPYNDLARKHKNVRVFKVPQKFSLGVCPNFAVGKARYEIMTKFDDDDYYAPHYLRDYTRAFKRSGADIVGKRDHFTYLEGKKLLLLRFSGARNRFVGMVEGGTLTFKKSVFRKMQFSNRSLGEDVQFCKDARANRLKIYATSPYNFAGTRRVNSRGHTWKVSYKALLGRKGTKIVYRGTDYRSFVNR